jgi:flagellin
MNSLRNLGMTNAEQSKAMTRLSTGLRITTAADDPAGLIISENFRSQIQSLGQAIRNNQDAINYSKTAEGALDEINRLLRDARSLAVASANTGTLDAAQIQANQSQMQSIATSVTRISTNTQFGTKRLLDGSAGVVAGATSNNLDSIYLTGQFNSASLTTNANVTVQVTTAATQATALSKTFAFGTTALAAGQFTINGVTFATTAGDNVNDLVNRINSQTGNTGVQAVYTTGGTVTLTSTDFGSRQRIDISDTQAVFLTAAGTAASNGADAVANVIIDTNGSVAGGLTTVAFTGGRMGFDGLTLSDIDGNVVKLSTFGNSTTAAFLGGVVSAGAANFQIGANANQTVGLSLGNFAAAQLGQGAISGLNLGNIDLTTTTGATSALSVIDQAISDVSRKRGEIGNFQRNVLESNIRSLGVSRETLSATESTIRDVDVADEMTNFTKLQILTQSGMSILAQANSAPQQVLALLRG